MSKSGSRPMPNSHLDLADEEFLDQFKSCALSPELFSHEAHLRLAWLLIDKHGKEVAINQVSGQIENYVDHLGARDKYHKTLTVAAVQIVHHFYEQSESTNFDDFILENPRLKTSFKELINSHYSSEVYNLEEARVKYFEPDLLPF